MVLVSHTAHQRGVDLHVDLGNLGVRTFFVLSGFLITTLLVREHAATGRISLSAFYLRRALRIFPPFYAFLLAMVALRFTGRIALPWVDVVHAATYTTNYLPDRVWTLGHVWSLAIEEQFYLVWPAALVIAGFRRGLAVAVAAMAVVPLLRVASFYLFPASRYSIGDTFPTAVDAIAAGCALAFARDRLWAFAPYRRLLGARGFALVPLLGVATQALMSHSRFFHAVGATVVNVTIAMSIDFAERTPGGVVGRVLNLRPVAAVGLVSYSIYLWQQPFFDVEARSWWCASPQSLVFLAACALGSYVLIERPALRLRALIEARRARSARGVVAPGL